MAALPPDSVILRRTNLDVVFEFSLDSNTQFLTRSSGRGWLLGGLTKECVCGGSQTIKL